MILLQQKLALVVSFQ